MGVESAHKVEEAAETGGRMIESAYHSHKLKPYREAAKAEKKLEKANINALYPVSYTHLDVYKRQIYRRRRNTGRQLPGGYLLQAFQGR